jgi:hypothetical protein
MNNIETDFKEVLDMASEFMVAVPDRVKQSIATELAGKVQRFVEWFVSQEKYVIHRSFDFDKMIEWYFEDFETPENFDKKYTLSDLWDYYFTKIDKG